MYTHTHARARARARARAYTYAYKYTYSIHSIFFQVCILSLVIVIWNYSLLLQEAVTKMERVAGIITHLLALMPVSCIIISLHNISNIKFLIVKSFFRDYTKKTILLKDLKF